MTRITVKTLDQKTAQRIVDTTYDLLRAHGLNDWKVRFSSASTRLGSCSYRTKTLRFSEVFAAALSWEETYNTILHEVAHAIAGPHAKHGPIWKMTARNLGMKNPTAATRTNVKIEKPWKGVCSEGHEHYMSRAPQRVQSCTYCDKGFNFEHVIQWKHYGQVVDMPVKYQVEFSVLKSKHIKLRNSSGVSVAA